MSTCRSCHAPIVWAVNDLTGKAMPLDAEPVDGGNVILHALGSTCTVLNAGQGTLLDDDEPRYVPHFATCPDADTWRKP